MVTHDFICWDKVDNTLGNHHTLLLIETPLIEGPLAQIHLPFKVTVRIQTVIPATEALLFLLET